MLVQKKAVRSITNSRFRDHTAPIFKKEQVLPLLQLITQDERKLAFRIWHNEVPPFIREDFKIKNTNRLRSSLQFNLPTVHSDLLQRLPSYKVPKTWNDTSTKLKSIDVMQTFATASKEQLIKDI